MKNLTTIVFLLFSLSAQAQIIGNKQIETKSYELTYIHSINIQMYAKVTIDMAQPAGITVTGESNILDFIQKKVDKGVLTIDQKEWIEPSSDIIIVIGAPELKELEHGTHDKTVVTNIKGEIFKVVAPIGEVILKGIVAELSIESKMGKVDASALICETAVVKIKSDGEVKVNASERVDCDFGSDARFENVNETAQLIECLDKVDKMTTTDISVQYINLKIKNNSIKRNHFVVVGPKPDGTKFSYGFPLMPFQSKNERWTVGTKVYSENAIGLRNLLVTLTAEDNGKMVKLFD